MRTLNPSSSHRARAVQAWQVLVCMAMNRQTTTYLRLSRLMYKKDAAGVLEDILGHLAYYCIDNGLPPLTSIVVGKGRGTPGHGIPINPLAIDEQREMVYEYDWYDIYPPCEDELRAAFENHAR